MGLCFSVPNGRQINPSLVNIFKEIASETGQCKDRKTGDLSGWACQGVYVMTTLTI
jgi:uracil-DNA glycosylase